MEYNRLFPYILNYVDEDADIWTSREDFMSYLNTPDILEQYAQQLMVTLPKPRMDYYQSSDYKVIKANVLGYISSIIQAIGLYAVTN